MPIYTLTLTPDQAAYLTEAEAQQLVTQTADARKEAEVLRVYREGDKAVIDPVITAEATRLQAAKEAAAEMEAAKVTPNK